MSEIQAMQIFQKVLEKLDRKERERVLTWACSKFLEQDEPDAAPAQPARAPLANRATIPRQSGNNEFVLVDSLDLEPEEGVSAKYFIRQVKPKTNKVKCLLATYYLQVLHNYRPISIDCIYTFFKHVEWPLPSDLRNSIHQAGKRGYLLTSESANLQVTDVGINAVENGDADLEVIHPFRVSSASDHQATSKPVSSLSTRSQVKK